MGASWKNTIAERGLCDAKVLYGVILAVIARLDRAIQYAETVLVEPIGRGVLDTRLRGQDDLLLGAASHLKGLWDGKSVRSTSC